LITTIKSANAAEAYDAVLSEIFAQPELRDFPQGMIHEIVGATVEITDPGKMLISSPARRFNYRSQISEGLWNCAPTDRIHFLERYNSGIRKYIANQEEGDRERATWAYGKYISRQLIDAAHELVSDPTSRRARVSIQYDGSRGTPPCLTSLQWFIRDGKLTQVTNMRSNDVWRGFPLDVVQFGLMHLMMAAYLQVPLGSYFHQVGSLHLYANDAEDAHQYYKEGVFEAHRLPTPGKDALITATRGDVLRLVDVVGHKAGVTGTCTVARYNQVPGLEVYAALLAGDYDGASSRFPGSVYDDLHDNGSGIGW
jgi:thymidylate synthase